MAQIKEKAFVLLSKQENINQDKARGLIMLGKVFLDKNLTDKLLSSNKLLLTSTNFYIKKKIKKFVSRGGEKLDFAIKSFDIDIRNKICIDIGSSTGGFTDCLLKNKAKSVVCVDSGTNQLDYTLRQDKRVIVKENYNYKFAKYEDFITLFDIATIDVSFISLEKMLIPLIDMINKDKNQIICLIKPQFEAKKKYVIDGLVKDKLIHNKILNDFFIFFEQNNFHLKNLTYSPITGNLKHNVEYLCCLEYSSINSNKVVDIDINNVVDLAWSNLYN